MIKKRLLPILMAAAMVFAMAPLGLDAVYADPVDGEPSGDEVLVDEGSDVNVSSEVETTEPAANDVTEPAKLDGDDGEEEELLENPLYVEGKNAVINYSLIKKKTRSLSVSKVLIFVNKGFGTLRYAKVSGNKKITINKTTGKVTVKKKLKRGTYSINVNVTASGDDTHAAVTQTVTFKVKITKPLKTKKILGTTCIYQGGFWFPKSLGERELSDTELKELGTETDIMYLQRHINTFADAVRFLKVNNCRDSEDNDISVQHALIDRASGRRAFCKAVIYLIEDNCTDSGLLHFNTDTGDSLCYGYFKKGSYYYSANPIELLLNSDAKRWMPLSKGKYVYKSLSSVISAIKKYDKDHGKIIGECNKENYPSQIDKPELTAAKIKELADDPDLTLEQASAEISTVSDAINFLTARGYTVGRYSYNHAFDYEGIHWIRGLTAKFTYENNAGSCGGTSQLFNRLLAGDFDEQGYVEMRSIEGGHIMNYFKRGDTYYFCDFTGVSFVDDPFAYLEYETTDPQAFGDFYLARYPEQNNIDSEYYLLNLYMYARDGQVQSPCGIDSDSPPKPFGGGKYPDLYANDIHDQTIILLEREGYTMRWTDGPPEDQWPPEINIPVDND
ncbi:MAG: cadherin repeat domain-containing protein [Ruminococcaceae bacterium]|nr:cadherin repeat domain-containing protein [Oscillospiraceae bacterium]